MWVGKQNQSELWESTEREWFKTVSCVLEKSLFESLVCVICLVLLSVVLLPLSLFNKYLYYISTLYNFVSILINSAVLFSIKKVLIHVCQKIISSVHLVYKCLYYPF